jgi:hypothetical protein
MALKDEIKDRKRPARRGPINGKAILTVEGKDPNYEYRIVNDVGHRVEMLKERGYETVEDSSVRIGDKRVATPKSVGSIATASVGGGITAVVMRTPKEFYDEDNLLKQAQVDELENATKVAPGASDYGTVKIDKGSRK